jgi:radical SAM superfamily enzyme
VIIHRLSGETYRAITVAPEWSIDKIGVHNALSKAFQDRDTWQGRLHRQVNARIPERAYCIQPEGAPN